MIRHADNGSNARSPRDFDEYRRHYPATHWREPAGELDLTDAFCALWNADEHPKSAQAFSVVLTPGLLAEWLPGCFEAARDAFARSGHRVLRTRVSSRFGVAEQAHRIADEVSRWLADDEPFIWCGHSKGGLELLQALESRESLRARCIAAVVVQPPVGISHVLRHLRTREASFAQRIANALLGTPAFAKGARDIADTRPASLQHWLQSFTPSVPTVCAVSWSIEPTSWVDSWHRTLRRVCPGIAHDGQFLTQDQVLPATPLVALPRIDHAQPVLGGNGFDAGRFWLTLGALASTRARQTD